MFDDEVLTIECSNCHKKHKITIKKARSNPSIQCSCGKTIKVDANDLDKKLNGIEKQISDFKNMFNK